jgi:hypothetical protein
MGSVSSSEKGASNLGINGAMATTRARFPKAPVCGNVVLHEPRHPTLPVAPLLTYRCVHLRPARS